MELVSAVELTFCRFAVEKKNFKNKFPNFSRNITRYPPICISTEAELGGTVRLNPSLNENKSNGNHIIKIIAMSSSPPKPYFINKSRFAPTGVGYF